MSSSRTSPTDISPDLLLEAVSTIFESLGRALVCLDHSFRIVHASSGLDRLIGPGTATAVRGHSAEEILGPELFAAGAGLRRALEAGGRREGWGATFQPPGGQPLLVSLSGAPRLERPGTPCDPRVAYVVVLRSADETDDTGSERPTIFSGLVARSAPMLAIFHLIEQLNQSEATVLISGDSGTGKELVSRAVHIHSPRARGPFVAVNCGAIPENLLESELFGHVRGAFTGAIRDRVGRFELAAGGTLFLDEVGDLPLRLQVKLLRVLQERTFERVGESGSRQTDVRVVAATNRHLRQAVLDGSFRDDLFYRLRVVPIDIPPLRSRREDIEPLSRHLLSRVGRRHGRILRLAPETIRLLHQHEWPGNVRELENALEYAVAVNSGQTILPKDLPAEIGQLEAGVEIRHPATRSGGTQQIAADSEIAPQAASTVASAEDDETARLRRVLDRHQWKREEAAAALGISRTTLWRKMREHGLLANGSGQAG